MTNLTELHKLYGNHIPYRLLLQTPEWKQRHTEIVERDSHQCKNCFNQKTFNHGDKFGWWKEEEVTYEMSEEWEELWDYYSAALGDEFNGMAAREGDIIEIEPYYTQTIIIVDKPYHLQVHHHYYIQGKYPWEYDNDALITLCNWCHFEHHQNNQYPPVYDKNKFVIPVHPCKRCNGAGFLPAYRHVDNGVCFRCGGEKYEEFIRLR